MTCSLLKPQIGPAALLLRIGLAAVFIVHGYFKVSFGEKLVPELTVDQQVAVGWTEIVCGGLLLVGLLTRLAAIVMVVFQAGAIFMVTGGEAVGGLSITRVGTNYTRVGPEYNIVLITVCMGLALLGAGWASVDHCLCRKFRKPAV